MARGSVSFRTERCKACELCVKYCPQDTLALDKTNINPMGYHPITVARADSCNGCGICAMMCPDLVITVERE